MYTIVYFTLILITKIKNLNNYNYYLHGLNNHRSIYREMLMSSCFCHSALWKVWFIIGQCVLGPSDMTRQFETKS